MTSNLQPLLDRVRQASGADRDAIIARFMVKTFPEPNSGCWLWDGATVPTSYGDIPRGSFGIGGRPMLAHRASYLLFIGEIPEGLSVCHKCDTPLCVNPDHLFVGTHLDNMADMTAKGRHFAARYPERAKEVARKVGLANTHARGEGNPKAKLTATDVAAIRMDARPTRFLAADYGVDRTVIQRIRSGVLWPALIAQQAAK